jgi:hypothetical protein
MGSPAIQVPERCGDSEIRLYEYDRFNEGNCLLSRRFLGETASVSAVVTGWEAPDNGGACVGFIAGDGAFTDYVLLSAGPERLEIRVPSGAQRGASFMDEGQPQWHVVAGADYRPRFPMRLTLRREGDCYTASVGGHEALRAQAFAIRGDARAVIKAQPRTGERYTPLWTRFDWAEVTGEAPEASLRGRVLTEDGSAIAGASVHVAGFDDLFTRTDGCGEYFLPRVPRGDRALVAAAEGYLFACARVHLTPGAENRLDIALTRETPESLPRREYNNPSFDRSIHGWFPLNGAWQFQFDPKNEGESLQWYLPGAPRFDRVIRVPFSWASLMGFGEEFLASGDKTLEANPCMNNFNLTGRYAWYRRSFTVPDSFPAGQNVVLHIGACTQVTNAWLDGGYLGMRVDEYGDLSFGLGALRPGSVHTLAVKVEYPHNVAAHNMGKQIFWFSSAPGIWQSVWIEPRSEAHIASFHLRPELEFDGDKVVKASFKVDVRAEKAEGMRLDVALYAPDGTTAGRLTMDVQNGTASGDLPVERPVLWAYRQGNLYEAECALTAGAAEVDRVRTRAGLRKVEARWLPGHSPEEAADPRDQFQYLYLNNRPFYVIGILDQGYNAFGIYTYRSLNAEGAEGKRGSIAWDVDRTMAYGYNLSRMHIKENEPLWYHECDKRGLLVWTEHPSNFYATPDDPDWQSAYFREMDGMLDRLFNHPSIVIVSSINESWGVEGRHVSTPWKNELRYRFLEAAAGRVKARFPHALVCDNSGFGKTNAGEINDFHLYPHDHFAARDRWEELVRDCYPGSTYNYINAARGEGCVGDAVQSGKPIFVSEFLHINGIDLQLRMFEKIAGYLRMNVASHEVENSGPMTADRFERDYGYVDERMRPLGYDMVNNMDAVVPDCNRITRIEAGSRVSVDVCTAHFSARCAKNPALCWSLTGIDAQGRYVEGIASGRREIGFAPYRVERQAAVEFDAPRDMAGAYLFLWVEDGEEKLCRNYVQFVFGGAARSIPGAHEVPPAAYTALRFEEYGGCHAWEGGSLIWIKGEGTAEYRVEWTEKAARGALIFEAGAREGAAAVKVTDEVKFPSRIDVYLDGRRIGCAEPSDDPSDERALFTNNLLGGNPFDYRRLGQFGYGERFEIGIPEALLVPGTHTLGFECGRGGMTLYGRGTGRYGFDPFVRLES